MAEQRFAAGPVKSWLSSFMVWATNNEEYRQGISKKCLGALLLQYFPFRLSKVLLISGYKLEVSRLGERRKSPGIVIDKCV